MTSATDLPRRSLWRLPAMRWLALYTFTGFTGFFATLSSLPAYLAAHGTSDSVAGLVTTTLLVATVGTQTLVPKLIDLFGMTTVLGAGSVFLGLPAFGLLHGGGIWWVLLISALRGIGFGILTVLGSMLTARIVAPDRRGEAVGIYGLAIALPNLLALAGGVALVTTGHFPIAVLLAAVPLLGLLTVWPLARAAGPDPDQAGRDPETMEPADPGRSAREIAARRSRGAARLAALSPAIVLMVVTLTSGGFMTYLPIARPDGALATVGLLVWGATGALARWRVGMLADRTGLKQLLPNSSVLSIVGVGAVFAGLLSSGWASWVVILVGAAILGIGFGATQNLTLVAAFARARQRETAAVSSVWNIGFDTGTAAGAGLVGALIPLVAIPGAMLAPALLIAASVPLAIRSGRPPEEDDR